MDTVHIVRQQTSYTMNACVHPLTSKHNFQKRRLPSDVGICICLKHSTTSVTNQSQCILEDVRRKNPGAMIKVFLGVSHRIPCMKE